MIAWRTESNPIPRDFRNDGEAAFLAARLTQLQDLHEFQGDELGGIAMLIEGTPVEKRGNFLLNAEKMTILEIRKLFPELEFCRICRSFGSDQALSRTDGKSLISA